MIGKINYAKGIAFEQRFSIYMMTELKYDKVRMRQSMTGSESVTGSQADIIGVIVDPRGKKLKMLALIVLVISMLLFTAIAFSFLPNACLIIVLALLVIGAFYANQSKKMDDKYTWVECKCRKTTSDIRMVRDFYNAVQDYNNSKDRKYGISKMIFVSASGFVDNAIQFASGKDIECYFLSNDKFQKVSY